MSPRWVYPNVVVDYSLPSLSIPVHTIELIMYSGMLARVGKFPQKRWVLRRRKISWEWCVVALMLSTTIVVQFVEFHVTIVFPKAQQYVTMQGQVWVLISWTLPFWVLLF